METKLATYANIAQIVADGQACKLRWPASERRSKVTTVLVDGVTANAVVAVYKSLISDENKAKLERLVQLGPDKVAKIAALAWKGNAK